MRENSWAAQLNGRQRTVHSLSTVLALLIASSMFFGLSAPTTTGVEFDCGPAAYALIAGPDHATVEHGDCGTAASKRLTTAVGLIGLTIIGSALGGWFAMTPRPARLRVTRTSAEPQRTRATASTDRVRHRATRTGVPATMSDHPHAD